MLKIISAIIAAILLFANTVVYASNPHYAIVIDAGSSGSRLHLFQYEEGKQLPIITELLSEKTAPGLSSHEDHPEQAGITLAKSLEKAKAELLSKQIDPQTVPLYLYGTAGMRILAENSPEKAAAVYSQTAAYITKNFPFKVEEIGTLPEKLEGIYGWLDVNYLAHHFDGNHDETVGTLDMGGASTEITYATQDKSRPDDEVTIKIGGNEYTVFSKSFLHLGQDQALKEINKQSQASDICYPINFSRENNHFGNYNFDLCSSLFSDLIVKAQHVSQQILPFTNQKFIAYSGFYYTEHFFFDTESAPSRERFETQVRSMCRMPWEQLKNAYPKIDINYLSIYCANASYFMELLYVGYGFGDGQLSFQNKIEQKDIDWTLGALLYRMISSE